MYKHLFYTSDNQPNFSYLLSLSVAIVIFSLLKTPILLISAKKCISILVAKGGLSALEGYRLAAGPSRAALETSACYGYGMSCIPT